MIFELPQRKHKEMFQAYKEEFHYHHETFIHGDGGCSGYDDFEEWVKISENYREGKCLPEGYVPSTTYFLIEGDYIVGVVNIRHELNESLLKIGGHVGYSVLPSYRRQGIATKILMFAIEKCHELGIGEILVTCDENNIGSRKTIEKCGGILENKLKVDNKVSLRFWIK